MPTIGGNIIKKVTTDCDGKGCPEDREIERDTNINLKLL